MKVITLDGPAGSGKSTVARLVAAQLGWTYVTTGALYRTLALLLQRRGKDSLPVEPDLIQALVNLMDVSYHQDPQKGTVRLEAEEISSLLAQPAIAQLASIFAQDPVVRAALLPLQRKVVTQAHGAIVDGRDMGTVVFPDAPLKIFLTATAEKRAQRRLEEWNGTKGQRLSFEEALKEIKERDDRDANRQVAPLKPAQDAIILDSSQMTPQAVASFILDEAKQRNLVIL